MRLRSWAAFAAGVVVAGVVAAQPPKIETIKPAAGSSIADVPKSADPLSDMLGEARTAYGKMRDYSGTYTRQERLNGSLSAQQVGEMKMRVNPVGVYVRFTIPDGASGMEVAYSGTRRNAKVRYRQAGAAGRKGVLRLEVDDAKFLADNRHPVTEWGMGPILELIATSTAREKKLNNPVETFTSDFQFANRNVTKYEILMRRPHALRYAARMVVFIDKETKLPIRYEAYDEPKAGTPTGDLLEVYSFTDMKYNTGLGENIFDF
ncbi:MAG TPA: DUF1571 domain-containing protein [Gemmata sp.]|jgi:hypothetical protein|nr:DUF1571 domain-containing protein [Gemmata sp.]